MRIRNKAELLIEDVWFNELCLVFMSSMKMEWEGQMKGLLRG